jgi:hypothetical protein
MMKAQFRALIPKRLIGAWVPFMGGLDCNHCVSATITTCLKILMGAMIGAFLPLMARLPLLSGEIPGEYFLDMIGISSYHVA